MIFKGVFRVKAGFGVLEQQGPMIGKLEEMTRGLGGTARVTVSE